MLPSKSWTDHPCLEAVSTRTYFVTQPTGHAIMQIIRDSDAEFLASGKSQILQATDVQGTPVPHCKIGNPSVDLDVQHCDWDVKLKSI